MRLLLIFIGCLVIVVIGCVLIGFLIGFMPELIPIVILTTLLTAVGNNRLESRRIARGT